MSDTPLPPPPPPSGGYTGPAPSGSPDVGSALSYGWSKFQQNAGVLIAIVLIPFAAQLVLGLIGQATKSVVGSLLFSLLGFVVSVIAQYGLYNSALMLTRGQSPTFSTAFQNDRWGEWVGFAIVYGIAVGVGAILCGIGILLTAGLFGLAPYFFIDGRQSIGSAIGASFNATKSNGSLFFAVMLCFLVGFLGIIACFVGLLVTIPMATIAAAYLYRNLIGQPAA